MAHAVVRTDNLTGIYDGSKLISAKYLVDAVPTAIDNGCVVYMDKKEAGQREVWEVKAPAANAKVDGKLCLVATPELMYDSRNRNLTDFTNEAGAIVRCYVLEKGDGFSVTADALTGITPVVGAAVMVKAATKLDIAAAGTADAIGTVVEIETVGTNKFFYIRLA